ncbi:hypothetical protein BP6252_06715 [Coleophoma cylindrospora]|uniref:Heterokaryon incompatibility domain-containing protein n=1 Tax=Coleophoma cylindrospora TaxID=1849047 RepID=A0A3D8RFT8_9HELO|nr:hypothetical protein BP6252_06715 [Coleophoma cylindrospora]
MRLLDVDTFEIQSGYPDQDLTDAKGQLWYESSKKTLHTPKYAILSHRWRQGEEVKFQDFSSLPKEQLRGFPSRNPVPIHSSDNPPQDQNDFSSSIYKIAGACKQVRETDDQAMRKLWIDTICVNQGDAQEVSTSINSMFRWYRNAEVCYVYLFDVSWDFTDPSSSQKQFVKSDWFCRGWTLQELLAPRKIKFFDRDWKYIGTKEDLITHIVAATRISAEHLGGAFRSASLGQKMSWLARRTTERIEDRAYCALGIFGIYLDTRYGSGEDEFMRLQEEIIRSWAKEVPFDESLFAWRADQIESSGILAPAPGCFRDAGDIMFLPHMAKHRGEQLLTGLKIRGPGMEIDNAGQMTLMVPCLGYMPAGAAGYFLTLGAAYLLTTTPAFVYQARRKHREVQLNCWTKGADGKLHTKKIKMECAKDQRWRRIDCGKLYDSSSTTLYPSAWLSNHFIRQLKLTDEIKYR